MMELVNLSVLPRPTILGSIFKRNFFSTCRTSQTSQPRLLGSSGNIICHEVHGSHVFHLSRKEISGLKLSSSIFGLPKNAGSSSSSSGSDDEESSSDKSKVPFGYTRKDVLLIGVGLTVLGVGLKYGLEFAGVDPLQAGNVVQLVLVLGLTVGWISTYIFRVSNKDMTYAKQLRDYEYKVMEKRLESLSEAEMQVLLEQVEEEKVRMRKRKSG